MEGAQRTDQESIGASQCGWSGFEPNYVIDEFMSLSLQFGNPGIRRTLFALMMVMLTGCVATPAPRVPVATLLGPVPVRNWTPMEDALNCLRMNYPKKLDIRMAVSDVKDGTGQLMEESSLSKVVTQRPDMMMVVGLAKTGVRQVNRNAIGVTEWELKQAMAKRLGDKRRVRIDGSVYDYRPVMAGTILGSTHYVSGAITEFNWNIKSNVAELGVLGAEYGKRAYHAKVAIDLMLTNTRTTDIVLARSYSKQILGLETTVGLFRFFNVTEGGQLGPTELFQFNLGDKVNEPTQTALRWIFETASYDFVSQLTGLAATCHAKLPEGTLELDNNHFAWKQKRQEETVPKEGEDQEVVAATAPKASTTARRQGASEEAVVAGESMQAFPRPGAMYEKRPPGELLESDGEEEENGSLDASEKGSVTDIFGAIEGMF
ncbi:MAG: hypothetical protein GY764_01930 [Halieaceae bacterium]|nr:hypothetical protein [Halieaceae bacterium]